MQGVDPVLLPLQTLLPAPPPAHSRSCPLPVLKATPASSPPPMEASVVAFTSHDAVHVHWQ